MGTISWILLWLIGLGFLAYFRASLKQATAAILVGLLATIFISNLAWYMLIPFCLLVGGLTLFFNHTETRLRYFSGPLFEFFRENLPSMSATEKQALDSGTVGWEKELFAGDPDWTKLLNCPAPVLTGEEQAFLDNQCTKLCEMVHDWECCENMYDLPPHVWEFIKKEGFWGLIIPKKFGGKGFSAIAHSTIVKKLGSRSLMLSSIVSVPNSLGPAELLLHYGTEEQKNYYLPRLAKAEDIPCFALTSVESGSDASAIPDRGIICKRKIDNEEILGIQLNWDKRYITLAPIATLLGLAFKLYDPEHLIGNEEYLGITCALIPTDLPGITIGRRHLPSSIPFQNGPTQGKNVFVPLDSIIGGVSMAGQGWRMLVECLSVGRAISLPAACTGGAVMGTFATCAYALIRQQFNTSIASFEGIQEVLARMGGYAFLCEATRLLTVNFVQQGEKPAVPGAIAKYHTTELGRKVAIDAMDIHGGKGIMEGPKNYISRGFQSSPIAITVEGANILTRNLIIFGQGSLRCHPYLLKEMDAVITDDFKLFDRLLSAHTGYLLKNVARAFFHGITFARFAKSPTTHREALFYRQITRASAAFALVADCTIIMLGDKLKFKELLSARLGDCLSMMYMASAILKYFADNNRQEEEWPLVQWSMAYCLHQFWSSMNAILSNLPNPWLGRALLLIVMPFGKTVKPPQDEVTKQVASFLTSEKMQKCSFFNNMFLSEKENDSLNLLREAFHAMIATLPIRSRLREAIKSNALTAGSLENCVAAACKAKIISEEEATLMASCEILSKKVLAVDDFAATIRKNMAAEIGNQHFEQAFSEEAVKVKR